MKPKYNIQKVICHGATGRMMRAFRKKSGVKQGQLARELGISAPHLSNLENGTGSVRWSEELVDKVEAAIKKLSKV